jgi:hypothetical protein
MDGLPSDGRTPRCGRYYPNLVAARGTHRCEGKAHYTSRKITYLQTGCGQNQGEHHGDERIPARNAYSDDRDELNTNRWDEAKDVKTHPENATDERAKDREVDHGELPPRHEDPPQALIIVYQCNWVQASGFASRA